MNDNEIIKQIENIYKSVHREWVKNVIIIRNSEIMKIYTRNNEEIDSSTEVPEPISNN